MERNSTSDCCSPVPGTRRIKRARGGWKQKINLRQHTHFGALLGTKKKKTCHQALIDIFGARMMGITQDQALESYKKELQDYQGTTGAMRRNDLMETLFIQDSLIENVRVFHDNFRGFAFLKGIDCIIQMSMLVLMKDSLREWEPRWTNHWRCRRFKGC